MLTRSKLIGIIPLIGLPVLAGILWLSSGHEMLTKSNKIVSVPVTDELFGGTNLEQRLLRGPLFGYYLGLDLVVAVTVAALVIGLVWWWTAWRKRHSELKREEGT